MSRDWLPAEVNQLVAAYKANDWNGVHASINRMLALDAGGAVVLTQDEAQQAAFLMRWIDAEWTESDIALKRRLEGSA